MIDRLDIICSYKDWKNLQNRYPKRKIHPDAFCPDDYFYYYSVLARRVRWVSILDGSIRQCDQERGFPYGVAIRAAKIDYSQSLRDAP